MKSEKEPDPANRSVHRLVIPALVVAAGLAAGVLTAGAHRSGSGSRNESAGPDSLEASLAPQHSAHWGRRPAQEAAAGHRYAALKVQFSEERAARGLRRAIERMTAAELRALLAVARFPVYGPAKTAEDQWLDAAAALAAEELFHREGMAALDWADATGRKETAFALLNACFLSDPTAAKDHLKHYPDGYWDGRMEAFIFASVKGAAMRSAQDLLATEKLWSGGMQGAWIPEVAAGFDFRKYLSETSVKTGLGSHAMLTRWAGLDAAGSGAYVREKLAAGGPENAELLAYALDGRARAASEDEAAQWACSLLPPYPQGDRQTALWRTGMEMSAARAAALIRHLPTDDDRALFTAGLLQGYGRGGQGRYCLDALRAMDTDALRTQALTRYVTDKSGYSGAPAYRNQTVEKVMNDLVLPEEARAQVRGSIKAEPDAR